MRPPFLLLALAALPVALAAADLASLPGFIEAESEQNLSGAKRVSDPASSGGAYVRADRNFNPVFKGHLPSRGDSFTIWVRHRGHGVQLKSYATDDQTQIEHKWSWYKGPDYKWSNLGTYSRVTLGQTILLIRGSGDDPDAGVDAVIFATDPAFSPESP